MLCWWINNIDLNPNYDSFKMKSQCEIVAKSEMISLAITRLWWVSVQMHKMNVVFRHKILLIQDLIMVMMTHGSLKSSKR